MTYQAPPITVIGDVLADVVVRPHGEIRHATDTASDIRIGGGGAAANVASWIVAAGSRARLVGRVGDDTAGRQQRADLARAGVELALTTDDQGRPTGACVVLIDPDGERTMLPDRGAAGALTTSDIPDAAFVAGAHLHVSGYSLLHAGSRDAARGALERAQDTAMTTSVDPASAAPLQELGASNFLELVEGVDLLLPNATEARVLTGGSADPRDLARLTGGEVVVTLGPDGAAHSDGLTIDAQPASFTDATGAGDAFAAGFLTARAGHKGVAAALRKGAEMAAHAVSQNGARPSPPPLLHITTAAQLADPDVPPRFFTDVDPATLRVLQLDDAEGLDVRIETAPDGDGDFPHLYGALDRARLSIRADLVRLTS